MVVNDLSLLVLSKPDLYYQVTMYSTTTLRNLFNLFLQKRGLKENYLASWSVIALREKEGKNFL